MKVKKRTLLLLASIVWLIAGFNIIRIGILSYTAVSYTHLAEDVFGVADITGAFIAGLIISNVQRSTYLETKFDTLSYLLLSPVFFASIGLKVELPKMSAAIVGFAVALTIVAVLTKVVGCGFGAKICHYKNYQAKRIGRCV